jgi:Domain of unknown function (DUF1992)
MTEHKPPGQSWESWIDEQIREAQEAGAFDNLAGAGKPIPDLGGEHDPDWWVKKLVQREGITELPPALELRRKVQKTLERLPAMQDEAEVRRVLDTLNAEIRKLNATVAEGPATTLAPLDVDDVVREWRRRR